MADWNMECVLRLPHGMPSVPMPSLIVGVQIFFLVQPVLECLDLRRDLKVVLHHLFSSSFTQQLMRDKGESWTVDGLFRALGRKPVVLPTRRQQHVGPAQLVVPTRRLAARRPARLCCDL